MRKYADLQLVGEYGSSDAALRDIENLKPDAMFLDIDMPGTDGFLLRKLLMQVPVCVFITNYPEYALESYELEAFDFLLKPITAERFEKMALRLREYFQIKMQASLLSHILGSDTIFIKEGTNQVRLQLSEVLYLEAMNDYTGIYTQSRRYMVLDPISNLISKNIFRNFVRIHRSYAVHKHFVSQFNANEVMLRHGIVLPVGRKFKQSLAGLLP